MAGDKITLERNLQRLGDIAVLPPDWNGYGAEVMDKDAIDNTKFILQNLNRQPEMFPTACRTVQLEYELSDDSYLEFEVYGDRIRCMMVPQRNYDDAVFYEIPAQSLTGEGIAKINGIIEEFYGRFENE